MPGFRHCSWCDGKGCICCDAEQKKFVAKAYAEAPKWREPDIRDVRDAWVKAEMMRGFRGLDRLTKDQVEEMFQPALDAEYARQFPSGPQPIFTASLDNPKDRDLMKQVFGREALERAFGEGGRGVAEIEENVAKAREEQAAK